MSTVAERWEKGLNGEVSFWRKWLASHHNKVIPNKKLVSKISQYIGDKKEVKIANIGSGPVSLIGEIYQDVNIEIFPSDILADEYMKLRKELDISGVLPIEPQDMTNLSYPDNTFDIVFCANAMDHCIDPFKAILEIIRVCKPDGYIHLEHYQRVGKKAGYGGLHQWNFHVENNEPVVWNAKTIFKMSDFPIEFKHEEVFHRNKTYNSNIILYAQKKLKSRELPTR